MAEPLVVLQLKTDELAALGDKLTRFETEKRMVQSALETLLPIARTEAPRRTGRSLGYIRGILEPRGDAWQGRIRALGKGFALRILAGGTNPKHEFIVPHRGRSRRGVTRTRGFGEYLVAGGTVITTRLRGGFVSLRFSIGGNEFFRRRVHSPRLKPNPWPDRTVGRGLAPVAAENERIVRAALDAKA